MAITAFLSRSPGLLNRGPGGPASLGPVLHSSIFSPTDLISNWLNRGSWGALCWVLVLSTASYLQQTWTSCRRGYIIIWRPLFFLRASQFRTQFNPSTVKVISWYSSTGCTCYLHRCISYFESLAGSEVNIQQLWFKFSDHVRKLFSFFYYALHEFRQPLLPSFLRVFCFVFLFFTNCYSSFSVVSIDVVKIKSSKDYHDSHSNHISKLHRPSRG